MHRADAVGDSFVLGGKRRVAGRFQCGDRILDVGAALPDLRLPVAQFDDRLDLFALLIAALNDAHRLLIGVGRIAGGPGAILLFGDALADPCLRRVEAAADTVLALFEIDADEPVRDGGCQFGIAGRKADLDDIALAVAPHAQRLVIGLDDRLDTVS